MEVEFLGERHLLKANIRQITNFLLSSYETSVEKNNELEYLNSELIKALETIKKMKG